MRSVAIRVAVGLGGFFSCYCSGSTAVSDPSPPEPSTVVLPADGVAGVLQGKVLFQGDSIPSATRIENTTDVENCAPVQSLQDMLVSSGGGLKNVIVHLPDVALPVDFKPQPIQMVLDNQDCKFRPHTSVLTSGSTIEAINNDPFFHSVHVYGPYQINLGLGPGQSRALRTLQRPGYYVVKCDVHGWMQAYFRVDRHPFHDVTGAEGEFRIDGIPPGRYVVEAWHEVFGKREASVTIAPGATAHITVLYHQGPP